MLLPVDDFAAAMMDIDSSVAPVQFTVIGSARPPCPRCQRTMESGRLARGPIEPDDVVLRCVDHGIWFGGGVLASWFATAGRAVNRMSGQNYAHDRVGGGGGGGGSSALSVSAWWLQKPRPRVHTLMTSAYQGQRLACPGCSGDLQFSCDRWACAGCAGSFVENRALESMVAEIRRAPWEVPPVSGAAGPRACPICGTAMASESIGATTVDRCAAHGVWFDEAELAGALEQIGSPERRGLGGWLKLLFSKS